MAETSVDSGDRPLLVAKGLSTGANPDLTAVYTDIHIIHRFYYGYDEYYYIKKILGVDY